MIDLNGKTVLVTGGTGSFGNAFIRTVLANHDVASIRVFSRDELKQSEMENALDDRRLRCCWATCATATGCGSPPAAST